MSFEPTPRFLIVRTIGLLLFIGLYVTCFGRPTSSGPGSAGSVAENEQPVLNSPAADESGVTLPALAADGAVQSTGELRGNDLTSIADGVADATELLSALLNDDDGLPSDVALPAGTYRLTRTIEIDLKRSGPISLHGNGVVRLVMEGAGPALRLVGSHTGTADPKTVRPDVWQRERMPLVDGIEILGKHPDASGLELTGTMQPTITRVTVRGARHGIHLVQRNRNVQISDCHLYDNSGVGIYLEGVNLHQINIVGCHISYNRQGGIVCRNSEIRNLQIGTCDIEGNMSDDELPTANILLDCQQGSVWEGAIVGCTIQHNRHSPDSANIRFVGQRDGNRLMVGTFSIANNVLSDVRVNVHLKHAGGVILTGNTFWEGFDHNLLIEGCNDIVVGANLFDRNPDYKEETSTNSIQLTDCHDCTLSGLHVHGVHGEAAALTLSGCTWTTLRDSLFLDNAGKGIELIGCERCEVTGCRVRERSPVADGPERVPSQKTDPAIVDRDGHDNRIQSPAER